jgi:hypothetical protein
MLYGGGKIVCMQSKCSPVDAAVVTIHIIAVLQRVANRCQAAQLSSEPAPAAAGSLWCASSTALRATTNPTTQSEC